MHSIAYGGYCVENSIPISLQVINALLNIEVHLTKPMHGVIQTGQFVAGF